MRALPNQPQSANIRALAQILRERFSGLTGGTIKLSQIPATTQFDNAGLELVFKNGALLDPGVGYTILGQTITLPVGAPAVVTDVFIVFYPYRTGV